jgi:hypothetical protein
MAKDIAEVGKVRLTQFFGGVDRGLCLQVTVADKISTAMGWSWTEMTREQVVQLAFELENWLKDSQDRFPPMGWTQEA